MKRWYKVYLANNDVRLMYRTWRERWRSNDKFIRFQDDNGHEFTFPLGNHTWILMWELIPNNEVALVRNELRKIKEALLKEREAE